jgi:hypothetical protein
MSISNLANWLLKYDWIWEEVLWLSQAHYKYQAPYISLVPTKEHGSWSPQGAMWVQSLLKFMYFSETFSCPLNSPHQMQLISKKLPAMESSQGSPHCIQTSPSYANPSFNIQTLITFHWGQWLGNLMRIDLKLTEELQRLPCNHKNSFRDFFWVSSLKPHPHTSPSDIFQCEKVGSAIRSLLESYVGLWFWS